MRIVQRPAVVLAVSYLVGAVPFSNLVARRVRGQDLRAVGTGTVSGTSLYHVAGFGPLALGGTLDVVKGAVGPLLAGPERPVLAAVAGALAVSGHNWSVYLGGRGGRGISPAMGALLVEGPQGAALLAAGLAVGRVAHQTALASLVADATLVPLLARSGGRARALAGTLLVAVLVGKRLTGNGPAPSREAYLYRLLYDRDTRQLPSR